MLRSLSRFTRAVVGPIRQALKSIACCVCRWARLALHIGRRLWRAHDSRIRQDPAYAGAVAIVFAAVLGTVPPRDALVAGAGALLGLRQIIPVDDAMSYPRDDEPRHSYDPYDPFTAI